jgi:VanZ family protein
MPDLKRRKKQYLFLALAWAIVVLIASVQPSKMMWKILPRSYMHDLAHIVSYGFFAYLFCFYLRFNRHFLFSRMTDLKVFFFSFLIANLWGGAVELIQILTHDRRADWNDCFHNAMGAFIGVMIFYVWHAFFHHPNSLRKKRIK